MGGCGHTGQQSTKIPLDTHTQKNETDLIIKMVEIIGKERENFVCSTVWNKDDWGNGRGSP